MASILNETILPEVNVTHPLIYNASWVCLRNQDWKIMKEELMNGSEREYMKMRICGNKRENERKGEKERENEREEREQERERERGATRVGSLSSSQIIGDLSSTTHYFEPSTSLHD